MHTKDFTPRRGRLLGALLLAAVLTACGSNANGNANDQTAHDTAANGYGGKTAGAAHNPAVATPSELSSNPSTYDREMVTVSGKTENERTRNTKRGDVARYQICDDKNACVHVVQWGQTGSIADGATVSITGRFHAKMGKQGRVSNVIVVGHRNREQGG